MKLQKPANLPEHLFCHDPIARGRIGLELIFSATQVAVAACMIPFTMRCVSRLQDSLSTRATRGVETDKIGVVQHVNLFNEIIDDMRDVNRAGTLCIICGITILLALLSISGFHLRTALVVRSLKGAISPVAHFMLIFCGAGIISEYLLYWSLSAEHDDYATLPAALSTMTNFILGDRPHTDAGEPGVTAIMHFFIAIFFMFIMVNVFVAIVLESYNREVDLVEEVPVEYSLFYDMWLMLLDTWKFRWSNSKKWALAQILSTAAVNCNAQDFSSEESFLRMIGEQHPQVSLTGTKLQYDDPVFGAFTFSENELRAYYRHVQLFDVLWPDSTSTAGEDTTEAGQEIAEQEKWCVLGETLPSVDHIRPFNTQGGRISTRSTDDRGNLPDPPQRRDRHETFDI